VYSSEKYVELKCSHVFLCEIIQLFYVVFFATRVLRKFDSSLGAIETSKK